MAHRHDSGDMDDDTSDGGEFEGRSRGALFYIESYINKKGVENMKIDALQLLKDYYEVLKNRSVFGDTGKKKTVQQIIMDISYTQVKCALLGWSGNTCYGRSTNKKRNGVTCCIFQRHILNTHPTVDSDEDPIMIEASIRRKRSKVSTTDQ